MEVKPVKQTEKPGYPLKTELNEEELKKQIPKRWMQSPAAKIALGTLAVVTLAGCAPPGSALAPPLVTKGAAAPTIIQHMPEGSPGRGLIKIAPLFLHGEGRGSFGCVMVSPPAFLTEDEALVVINDAAEEYGLKFTAGDGAVVGSIRQPVTNIYGSNEENVPVTYEKFAPDFADAEHGISIEYVSTDDVRNWNQGKQTISGGTYDTKDAAAQLSEALEYVVPQDFSSHNVGVLYDPCARIEPGTEEMSQPDPKSYTLAREQLAAQAKDFFEWLKEQGVI